MDGARTYSVEVVYGVSEMVMYSENGEISINEKSIRESHRCFQRKDARIAVGAHAFL